MRSGINYILLLLLVHTSVHGGQVPGAVQDLDAVEVGLKPRGLHCRRLRRYLGRVSGGGGGCHGACGARWEGLGTDDAMVFVKGPGCGEGAGTGRGGAGGGEEGGRRGAHATENVAREFGPCWSAAA